MWPQFEQMRKSSPDLVSFTDPFCQLPNRTALRLAVQQALADRSASATTESVIVVFGLDSLIAVNARYGIATGDAYLFAWAQRFRRLIGAKGSCFYVFGSQFAVLLSRRPEALAEEALQPELESWLAELERPFELAEKRLEVALSVGVVRAPQDGRDFDELLANAYAAREEARGLGNSNIVFFSSTGRPVRVSQLDMVSELNAAIEDGAFELHYQPTINVQSGQIVGLEALIRWRHPQRGMVAPLEFIPVAEETGLIHQIGRWTVRQLLVDLEHWRQVHGDAAVISFNVSPRELSEHGFVEGIDEIFTAHGGTLPEIEIEMTENIMVQYPERSARVLRRLQGRGMRIAIDDFGSGYASLLYLQRFPVDKIKIDRYYINGLIGKGRERAVVSAAIQLARDLRAEVVAEGVETQEQATELERMDCVLMQGYFFCRPMPIKQLMDWATAYPGLSMVS